MRTSPLLYPAPRAAADPLPPWSASKTSVTTTIADDDPLPNNKLIEGIDIRLSVSPGSVNEGAGDTDFTVTATHTGDTENEDVTIKLSLDGSADSPSDYTVSTALASVTIPANATSGSGILTLNLKDDDDIEGDETITVGGTAHRPDHRIRSHHCPRRRSDVPVSISGPDGGSGGRQQRNLHRHPFQAGGDGI